MVTQFEKTGKLFKTAGLVVVVVVIKIIVVVEEMVLFVSGKRVLAESIVAYIMKFIIYKDFKIA